MAVAMFNQAALKARGLWLGGHSSHADHNLAVLRDVFAEVGAVGKGIVDFGDDAYVSLPPGAHLDLSAPGKRVQARLTMGLGSAFILHGTGQAQGEGSPWVVLGRRPEDYWWRSRFDNLLFIHADVPHPRAGPSLTVANVQLSRFTDLHVLLGSTGGHGPNVALQLGSPDPLVGTGGLLFDNCYLYSRSDKPPPGTTRDQATVRFANAGFLGNVAFRNGAIEGCIGNGANLDFRNAGTIDTVRFTDVVFKDAYDNVQAILNAGKVANPMFTACHFDGCTRAPFAIESIGGFGPLISTGGWYAAVPGSPGTVGIRATRANGGGADGINLAGGYMSDDLKHEFEVGAGVAAPKVAGVYAARTASHDPEITSA